MGLEIEKCGKISYFCSEFKDLRWRKNFIFCCPKKYCDEKYKITYKDFSGAYSG